MKLPSAFVPNKNLDNKVKDFILNKPKFPVYSDNTLYPTVIYSSLDPKDLESMNIGSEKLSTVTFHVNYENGLYQISFKPYLSIRECRTWIDVVELDGTRDGLKSLIKKLIVFHERIPHHDRVRWDEKMIKQSFMRVWYAKLELTTYYYPRAIANFAKNFLDEKRCLIHKVIFQGVTEKELKESGLPENKIIEKKLENETALTEGGGLT